MVKAIIFDMDGVLVDSESFHLRAYNKILARYGKSISAAEFHKGFGSLPAKEKLRNWLDINDESELNRLSGERDSCFGQLINDHLVPSKDAACILENMKNSGFRLGLATSASRESADLILKKLEIEDYFESIICANDFRQGKPDPEIFLNAAGRLNVNASDCVVIEDSRHGIEAARNAGMKCIAVATSHRPEELDNADRIVNGIEGITLNMLKEL